MYTQSNTSFGIIVYNHDFEHTVYDCLLNDFPVQEVIQETDTPNLYVLPATIDLVGAEVELAHAPNRHGRMKLIIEQIKDDFDFIFIDCLPSLGVLSLNALNSADSVMIASQCTVCALYGLVDV